MTMLYDKIKTLWGELQESELWAFCKWNKGGWVGECSEYGGANL